MKPIVRITRNPCVIALALLAGALASPAAAQGDRQGGPVDAPTGGGSSTPQERAETAALNRQISDANRAADAKAAQDKVRYDQQRAAYEEAQARYRDAMQRHQAQQRDYDARRTAYEAQRARYDAVRGARHPWPDHGDWIAIGRDFDPLGRQVRLPDDQGGAAVVDVARTSDGRIQALKLKPDGMGPVWIDGSDVRYNRAEDVLLTDLDRRDLQEMAAGSQKTP